MADKTPKYQPNTTQLARPGKWVRFTDMYGSGLRRQSYDGKFVYETHYDKGAGQPKTVNVWGSNIATLPVPPKPGSPPDVMGQLSSGEGPNVSKILGTKAGFKGGQLASVAATRVFSPALAANLVKAGAAFIIPGALTLGLALAGKRPGESNLAAPVFGAERGHNAYGTPPGNPGYKGATYQGDQPVGKTVAQDVLEGWPGRETNPLHIPEKLLKSNNYFEIEAWKAKVRQLDSLLRKEVGRGVPTGTLYPNYTSATRYADEAHGSRPITYEYPGPEGEFEAQRLAGGLGLTNLGRVTHKEENKRGIPVDYSGDRFKATRTAYYATRALVASGGKMDPELALQIGEEKAARAHKEMVENLKPVSVAWGRHDNPINPKTAQLLKRAAEPKQAVWNQAENEWQDTNLGLKVDQKAAWKRWELTRPINQANNKPKDGSVVSITGTTRPPEQAVFKDGPGGLAWRDPRTNAVIDQKQALARWETTRPAGDRNDKPRESSVVDLAPGQWQSFTDEYGHTGYQRVGKNGKVFETRYEATGTNQPPRLSASIQNGALGGERTSQAHVPKPTKPKIVIDEVDSHTNIGSRQRAPGAFIPKAGKGEIAKVVQNPNSGVTTTYLKNGAIYSQKLGANAYRSKPPDIVALNRVDIQTPSYLQQFGTPDQQDRNAGQEVTDNQPKYSYPPVDYATDERHPAEVLGAKPQSPPAKAVAPTTGTSNQLDPAIQAAMNRQQTASNPYGIRDFNEDGLDDITGQPVAEIVNDAWKISQPEAPKPPTATNPAALYSGNPNDDPMGEPAQPTGQPVVAANPTIIASGNPTGIYEAPKAGAPLTGIVPSFDPGENIPRGKMGMY